MRVGTYIHMYVWYGPIWNGKQCENILKFVFLLFLLLFGFCYCLFFFWKNGPKDLTHNWIFVNSFLLTLRRLPTPRSRSNAVYLTNNNNNACSSKHKVYLWHFCKYGFICQVVCVCMYMGLLVNSFVDMA